MSLNDRVFSAATVSVGGAVSSTGARFMVRPSERMPVPSWSAVDSIAVADSVASWRADGIGPSTFTSRVTVPPSSVVDIHGTTCRCARASLSRAAISFEIEGPDPVAGAPRKSSAPTPALTSGESVAIAVNDPSTMVICAANLEGVHALTGTVHCGDVPDAAAATGVTGTDAPNSAKPPTVTTLNAVRATRRPICTVSTSFAPRPHHGPHTSRRRGDREAVPCARHHLAAMPANPFPSPTRMLQCIR